MYFEVWFGFSIAGAWTFVFFVIAAILFAIHK
jgi:hypothetical protein